MEQKQHLDALELPKGAGLIHQLACALMGVQTITVGEKFVRRWVIQFPPEKIINKKKTSHKPRVNARKSQLNELSYRYVARTHIHTCSF